MQRTISTWAEVPHVPRSTRASPWIGRCALVWSLTSLEFHRLSAARPIFVQSRFLVTIFFSFCCRSYRQRHYTLTTKLRLTPMHSNYSSLWFRLIVCSALELRFVFGFCSLFSLVCLHKKLCVVNSENSRGKHRFDCPSLGILYREIAPFVLVYGRTRLDLIATFLLRRDDWEWLRARGA